MIDTHSLPISGSIVIAGLLYIGASVFITGPLVAKRTIDKSGWNTMCVSQLQAEIDTQRTPPKSLPSTDCQTLFGWWTPEVGELCQAFGNPDFGGPEVRALKEQEQRRQQLENQRLAQAAAQTGARCYCAAAVVAKETVWAIHAGSLRLISPPEVTQLSATLTGALNAPQCRIST